MVDGSYGTPMTDETETSLYPTNNQMGDMGLSENRVYSQ